MAWNITRTNKSFSRIISDKGMLVGTITTNDGDIAGRDPTFHTEMMARFDIKHQSFNEACAFVRGVEATMRAFKIYKENVINGPVD